MATTSLRSLLVLALVVLNTSARICDTAADRDPYRYSYDFQHPVSNQDDVNTRYKGCTEILGAIYIANNYTGPFYLANVTSVSRGILTTDNAASDTATPLLTSIELPDLNYTAQITIYRASSLTTVSCPRLSIVGFGIQLAELGTFSADFPSLTNITQGGLFISGNFTSLDFPLLADMSGGLSIHTNPSFSDPYWRYSGIDRSQRPPIDISFPALQNVDSVFFAGNISSLSMPRLELNPNPRLSTTRSGEVRIYSYGNPLSVSLPSLSGSTSISLAGTIGSTSFPSLRNVSTFEINSFTPLNVTLAPLEAITYRLQLDGNITGISMSTVTDLGEVIIKSDLDIDCSPAIDAWDLSHNRTEIFSCKGPVHPPKSKRPLKLGLGIGLGIPAFLALCYGFYLLIKKNSRELELQKLKYQDTPPEYNMGIPPKYNPPADGGSEQGLEPMAGTHSVDGGGSVQEEGAGSRRAVQA